MSESEVKTETEQEQTSKMFPSVAYPGFFTCMSPHSRRFKNIVVTTAVVILIVIWLDYNFHYSDSDTPQKSKLYSRKSSMLTHNAKFDKIFQDSMMHKRVKNENDFGQSKVKLPKDNPNDVDEEGTDDKDDEDEPPPEPKPQDSVRDSKPCICPPPINRVSFQMPKSEVDSKSKSLNKTELSVQLPNDLVKALDSLSLEEINMVTQVLRNQLVKMRKFGPWPSSAGSSDTQGEGKMINRLPQDTSPVGKMEVAPKPEEEKMGETGSKQSNDNVDKVRKPWMRSLERTIPGPDTQDQNAKESLDSKSKAEVLTSSKKSEENEAEMEVKEAMKVDTAVRRFKSEGIPEVKDNKGNEESSNQKEIAPATADKIVSTADKVKFGSRSGQRENENLEPVARVPGISGSETENSEKTGDVGGKEKDSNKNYIEGLPIDKATSSNSTSIGSVPANDTNTEPEEKSFGVGSNDLASNFIKQKGKREILADDTAKDNEGVAKDKDKGAELSKTGGSDLNERKPLRWRLDNHSDLSSNRFSGLRDHRISKRVLEEPGQGIQIFKTSKNVGNIETQEEMAKE